MSDSNRYNPDESQAEEIIDQMSDRRMLSESSAKAAKRGLRVPGGIHMRKQMGGVVARRVGSKSMSVLWVIDKSGSQLRHLQATINAMKGSHDYLLNEQRRPEVNYTINLAIIAFSSDIQVIMPPTPVENVDRTIFDTYKPSGSTALLDAWMTALVGDSGYSYLLSKDGAPPQLSMLTLFTDTGENSSTIYGDITPNDYYRQPPQEMRDFMADLRKGRKHVLAAINFGGDRDYLRRMGFLDRNILDIGEFNPTNLAEAFRKSSQAAVNLSQQLSSGGSQAVQGEDPASAYDNAMFN